MNMRKGMVMGWTAASLVAFAVGNAGAAGEIMQPGKWQITSSMEMEGMPPGAAHPMTVDQCIKPEDVKDAKSMASRQVQGNKKCTVSEPKWDNHTMSFDFTCENGSTGHTEMTFENASYTGSTTINMKAGPQGPMKVVQHVQAKRTGDC